MGVRTAAYAYPWDLNGDPRAAERFAELGIDAVVLAAAYHSVRAATPRHPRHRVVDARSAALYMPVRADAWGELIPADASPWAGERSFTRAAGELRLVGLPVRAWVVLTHSTAVGLANPWACVRNAFGDVYPYALCPSVPAVRDYSRRLVGEVVRQSGVTDVVLEACGPMGVNHLGHHEKTAEPTGPRTNAHSCRSASATPVRRRSHKPTWIRRNWPRASGPAGHRRPRC